MRIKNMAKLVQSLFGVALLTTRVAAQIGGEGTTRFVGLTASAYASDHPEGGPGGRGLAIGAERHAPSWAIRASLTGLKTVVTADDIGLCHPLPYDGCLPDPVFPASLWTLEGLSLIRLLPQIPVWGVAGGGLAMPVGRRAGTNGSNVGDEHARTTGTWRLGGELQLGRGPRAARLQLTRSGYSSRMMSLDGLVTLQLQFAFK